MKDKIKKINNIKGFQKKKVTERKKKRGKPILSWDRDNLIEKTNKENHEAYFFKKKNQRQVMRSKKNKSIKKDENLC